MNEMRWFFMLRGLFMLSTSGLGNIRNNRRDDGFRLRRAQHVDHGRRGGKINAVVAECLRHSVSNFRYGETPIGETRLRVLNSGLGFWRTGPKMSRRFGFFDYWKRQGLSLALHFATHCCVRFSESRYLMRRARKSILFATRRETTGLETVPRATIRSASTSITDAFTVVS